MNDYTAKTLKHDSAQKARDARRKIFQEREVFIVRRSDWKIEATPQIGFSQQNNRCFNIYRTECYTMLNKGDIRKAMALAGKLCQFLKFLAGMESNRESGKNIQPVKK